MSSVAENETIGERIQFWGKTDPETPAFIFWSEEGTRELTRGDVLDVSSCLASRLSRCGVQPGDVVCISLPNCPERVVAEFGVHLAGAVSMNGQVLRADGEDLIASLIKAECKCIIFDPTQTKGAWTVLKSQFEIKFRDGYAVIKSKKIPSLRSAIFSTSGLISDLKRNDDPVFKKVDPDSRAVIFTTSGSTGYSKLVEQNHRKILMIAQFFYDNLPLTTGSTYLNCSPLGWIGGYPFLYLISGCTWVQIDERFEVCDKSAMMWDIISQMKIDATVMTPIMLAAVPEDLKGGTNLHILTGGQPIKSQHLQAVKGHADKVSVLYGSTEVGGVSSVTIPLDRIEDFQDFMVGYPSRGVQFKVVDKEDKTLPYLSKGEVLVKSASLCTSYVGLESHEDFLPDGWFRTGDVGYLREDGCLFVEGRGSDAIMHGAYILYPSWWEQKLVNCPGVKEAVIVPVPDKVLHHEICACIKLDDASKVKPSSDDVISFCKQETLLDEVSSMNVVPKYVLFFDNFLKTNTDKLDRKGLARISSQRLNLSY